MEDLQAFRLRVRGWLAENMEPLPAVVPRDRSLSEDEELAVITKQRDQQRKLFDAGLAGLCFPEEYGGQGLDIAYQRVFDEEVSGYDMPGLLQVPSLGICGPVLLEFGTEEQKQRYLPPLLRGDELWMQFLSEPTAGSDVAGCITSAVPDGDEWILNGSKVWTSGAWWSDYALCLARTNVKIHQPGIEVHRIEMINGSREFCQEFITDVRIPDSDRIGPAGQGWSVATKWLHREREAVGGGSAYVTKIAGVERGDRSQNLVRLARSTGKMGDPRARQLVGEAVALGKVQEALGPRMMTGIGTGKLHNTAAALLRLYRGLAATRMSDIGLELAGSRATVWRPEEEGLGDQGMDYLMRQAICIGGGTTEMARNVIADRLIGMPREITPDRDRPFRDVPKNATPKVS
jgi:alkylation response protein AidB-like acyl-CoA dehydrogenase